MRPIAFKVLPILILFSMSLAAQVSSNPSAIHGTYKTGDTLSEYNEDPETHVHEHIKIIKETKLTPAEAASMGIKVPPNMRHTGTGTAAAAPKPDTGAAIDTAAQAPVAAAPDTTVAASDDLILANTSNCSCINGRMLLYALGMFGLAFLLSLYLFVLLLRDQVRPPFVSAIHAVLVTIGMTLVAVYSVLQPFPMACLMILILAGLSCLGLLYYDVTSQKAPKALGIVHGVLALTGLVYLVVFASGL